MTTRVGTVALVEGALCVIWIVSLLAAGARAQAADADPAFDVTSIRRNISPDSSRSFRIEPGGTVRATNVTVRHLMWQAYGVNDFQIIGGPGWMATERYDIIARAGDNATPERLRAMMRRLLADRFRLDVEQTTRDLQVYALLRARPDGTPGPQLRAATGDCAQPEQKGCGATVGDGTLRARGITMSRLAGELTGWVEALVQDRTDLRGSFELELSWSPTLQSNDSRAPLFTALREQLGLKLEPTRAPVPALVIRSVERPSEN
jgi:uncharacterized protein (TIGR03435 family)